MRGPRRAWPEGESGVLGQLGEAFYLLLPIRLASLSTEQSLLAGPVTLVGKLVRSVRQKGQAYADNASLATFSVPTQRIQDVGLRGDGPGMADELDADAVVLAPGAVILLIAIYK